MGLGLGLPIGLGLGLGKGRRLAVKRKLLLKENTEISTSVTGSSQQMTHASSTPAMHNLQ